jgi:hypothetical protein
VTVERFKTEVLTLFSSSRPCSLPVSCDYLDITTVGATLLAPRGSALFDRWRLKIDDIEGILELTVPKLLPKLFEFRLDLLDALF